MIGSLAANPPMRPAPCTFCQRVNPADSKFCNACGAPLPLVPCARCGAVNDPGATACYQCAAPLQEAAGAGRPVSDEASGAARSTARTAEGGTEPAARPSPGAEGLDDAKLFATLQELQRLLGSPDPGAAAGRASGDSLRVDETDVALRTAFTPFPDAPRSYPAPAVASPTIRTAPRLVPRRHRHLTVIVGTVVLAVLAAGAYYASRERPVADVPAASGAVKDVGSPAAAGALVIPPAGAGGAAPAASSSALGVPAPVAADNQSIAPGSSVTTSRPGPAAAADPPSPATAPVADSSGGTGVSKGRPGAVARDPSEAAAVPGGGARPRRADAGPGIIERPPRVGPCTEQVAALGLCAPETIQRRE